MFISLPSKSFPFLFDHEADGLTTHGENIRSKVVPEEHVDNQKPHDHCNSKQSLTVLEASYTDTWGKDKAIEGLM